MSKQRVLVVADRTADAPELIEALRRRGAVESAEVTLLVPARRRPFRRESEQRAWAKAIERADAGVAAVRAAGIDCEGGVVADPDPVIAVGDALHAGRFDEVVLASPPPGLAALLGQDLVERLRAETELPVAELTIHPIERRTPSRGPGAPVGAAS